MTQQSILDHKKRERERLKKYRTRRQNGLFLNLFTDKDITALKPKVEKFRDIYCYTNNAAAVRALVRTALQLHDKDPERFMELMRAN